MNQTRGRCNACSEWRQPELYPWVVELATIIHFFVFSMNASISNEELWHHLCRLLAEETTSERWEACLRESLQRTTLQNKLAVDPICSRACMCVSEWMFVGWILNERLSLSQRWSRHRCLSLLEIPHMTDNFPHWKLSVPSTLHSIGFHAFGARLCGSVLAKQTETKQRIKEWVSGRKSPSAARPSPDGSQAPFSHSSLCCTFCCRSPAMVTATTLAVVLAAPVRRILAIVAKRERERKKEMRSGDEGAATMCGRDIATVLIIPTLTNAPTCKCVEALQQRELWKQRTLGKNQQR